MRRRLTISAAVLAVLCAGLSPLAAPAVAAAPSEVRSAGLQVSNVEAVCAPATPGTARCLALRRTDLAALPAAAVSPLTSPSGYGPADLQSAYALPSGTQGSGLTVAIVDAYDLPTAESDLAAYRSQFGLPACTTANGCFHKVNQSGGTSYPATAVGKGWDAEIALDIDMVSAACPLCNILLVEANSPKYSDLGPAVNTAVSMGAVAVSNSYGGPESISAPVYDTAYYNHPGVAITASTGDCGYNCSGVLPSNAYAAVEYPAASPYVIAVGGTKLLRAATARGWTESAWGSIAQGAGAGSGCSVYEPKPSWQHDPDCANRTQADVSAVADPATGVAVYLNGSWGVLGGTSAASPIIAAVFALAGGPAADADAASYVYAHKAALNDVIGGNNLVTDQVCTVAYLCNGVTGYDGPTGLGTPNGTGAFSSPSKPGKPAHLAAIAGNLNVNLTWTAPGSGSSPITSYTVTEIEAGLGVVACSPMGATSCKVGGLTNGTEYTFTVHASNLAGDGPESDPSPAVIPTAGATYHTLTPARVLDSRPGTGHIGAALFHSRVKQTFLVANGASGVPTDAVAVTGNVTVVGQSRSGYVVIAPSLTTSVQPPTSTINFPLGDTRANGVTVALATGGNLDAMYWSSSTADKVDILFDVTGYFSN